MQPTPFGHLMDTAGLRSTPALRVEQTRFSRNFFLEADARTRTGDPFITSEVLYQLSYVGGDSSLAAA